jgi:hypothetical protein
MLLRLCKSLAASMLLIFLCYALPVLSGESFFDISYFPEVVFKETPLTLHLRRPAVEPVQVLTNGTFSVTLPASADTLTEYVIFPKTAMRLRFQCGNSSRIWQFQVLEPDFVEKLHEQDGFLYDGECPVILMPQHRLPPVLDRRWETVEIVENMIQADKKPITRLTGFLPETSALKNDIAVLLPTTECQYVNPNPANWFRVHGYLTLGKLEASADFVAVEIDLYDLQRGMSPEAWFMKWQFVLQHLQSATGYADGLLFGPEYDEGTLQWKAVLDPQLKGLASAHGLRFVDRSLSPALWQERLLNQLGKSYLLP